MVDAAAAAAMVTAAAISAAVSTAAAAGAAAMSMAAAAAAVVARCTCRPSMLQAALESSTVVHGLRYALVVSETLALYSYRHPDTCVL